MQDEQDKYFTFAAGLDVPFQRYSFGSTTTVFISGITTGTGTLKGQGGIYAIRTF